MMAGLSVDSIMIRRGLGEQCSTNEALPMALGEKTAVGSGGVVTGWLRL